MKLQRAIHIIHSISSADTALMLLAVNADTQSVVESTIQAATGSRLPGWMSLTAER